MSRLLTDLMKIYSNSEQKYGGGQYDILDVKLQRFFDYCSKINLPREGFHHTFSIMLKGRAQEFYYDKISGRSYDF
jgi:hypothetical protein